MHRNVLLVILHHNRCQNYEMLRNFILRSSVSDTDSLYPDPGPDSAFQISSNPDSGFCWIKRCHFVIRPCVSRVWSEGILRSDPERDLDLEPNPDPDSEWIIELGRMGSGGASWIQEGLERGRLNTEEGDWRCFLNTGRFGKGLDWTWEDGGLEVELVEYREFWKG